MVQKSTNTKAITKINCSVCGKEIVLDNWEFRRRSKNQRGIFCSFKCANTKREKTKEEIEKIVNKQKGKSVITRGRPGHIVSEETKEKIRQSKLKFGSIKPDWAIVKTAANDLRLTKYVITRAPIPDIIYVENGKLVAVEVEKKPFETDVRKKMDNHNLTIGYDKVIIMWYLPSGTFMRQFIWENGEWKNTTGEAARKALYY